MNTINTQSRKWILTLCNPMDYGFNRERIIETLDRLSLSYYCLADEIADTGMPHTHIYVYRDSPLRFNTLHNAFPHAHIETARGSSTENRDYVLKCGKWEGTDKADTSIEDSFVEYGICPQDNRSRESLMTQVMDDILAGLTTAEIIKLKPRLAFRIKDIDMLRELLLSEKYAKENRDIEVYYYWGDSGSGKTQTIYANNDPADICRLTSYSRDRVLFDFYHGQSVVVFEEFHSQIPIGQMLNFLDIYPLQLPARYNDRTACYSKVYITSNIPLEEQYRDVRYSQPEVWRAWRRRIHHIVHFEKQDYIPIYEEVPFYA